jgi:DNA-binding NarL/FixJ family response regulator
MTTVLLLDDAAPVSELLADELRRRGGYDVIALASVEALEAADLPPLDIALVDLSFPNSPKSGLDALLLLHRRSAQTRLVVLTQGDDWVADLLRDAWEAVPLASVASKSGSIASLLALVAQVERDGTAPLDPVLRPLLPEQRSPLRSAEAYGRLVQHLGHAKLWRALIEEDGEPTYRALSRATGLSVNTVRNYREQLLGELALHGLDNPSMREMKVFARRCRPLLEPHLRAKLDRRGRS